MNEYEVKDPTKYQVSYEELSKRNASILKTITFGISWAFLFFSVLQVQWFAGEAFAAYEEMTTEEPFYEGTQEECQASAMPEGCEIRNFNGGIWWSLLSALLVSIGITPLLIGAVMLTYRTKDVSKQWRDSTFGLLIVSLPLTTIWALLWLICLPFTWGLLPWGEWSVNWWKIFPFGFGIIWMAGLPFIAVVTQFFKKLANPEYNYDLGKTDAEDEHSSSTTAEQIVPEVANVTANKSSYVESEIPPKPSLGGRAIFVAILAVIMMIPGVIMLILGGVLAEGFIEGEGSSNYSLEIIDEDGLGDQGFIIFIQGTPGDFNGNGVHDYCENVIVNATHSGAWMSDPWTGWSSYNGPDETRQVFELQAFHDGSGCDAQHWPKEKWVNEVQLVKLGRACYGCMAGNTTITAEYANEPTKPVGMWIQDAEKVHESTVLTIIGAILTGIGTVTLITIVLVKISKSKAAESAGIMPSIEEEKEPIEIIESNPGQPVRFIINDPPKGKDAWVGIYPASTGDQDHGDRWRWLRDIDANNATLPGQSAGRWSIRVFSDGGYNQIDRLDFDITGAHGNAAQLHPADGRYELATDELSWNEHNDRALAMGGHLVSITSAEENELVARIAGERTVWIGGMRKGSGNGPGADHWCWCDGQPWIYANWAPGEPNNYGGNENRVHLYGKNKLWNDVGEGWRGPAVYQLPKEKSIQSAKKIQSALKKSSGKEKSNFWDSVN